METSKEPGVCQKEEGQSNRKQRNRLLKIAAWIVGSVVGLTVLLMCLIVWIFTPARLTPLANRFANEYLNADVSIGKVELTLWKTFPNAMVDVKNVEILSKVLPHCDSIPADADSLLSVGSVRASVNLLALMSQKFDVGEVSIDSIKANLVAANDSVANYMVMLPGEDKEEEDASVMALPDVVVRKFQITNNQGIRYRDLSTGMSATVDTETFGLYYDKEKQAYNIRITGDLFAGLPEFGISQSIPFDFGGNVGCNTSSPYLCRLQDFNVEVSAFKALINADIAVNDSSAVVKAMDLKLGPVSYADVMAQLPEQYTKGLDGIRTDLSFLVGLNLDKPFNPAVDAQPTFHADVIVPDCYVATTASDQARIEDFALNANLAYDGEHPEKSTVKLERLLLEGFGIRLNVSGNATELMGNPKVNARFDGRMDFAKVLKLIPEQLPMDLSGSMDLATSVGFALSDLDVKSFHKMKIDGTADFRDVHCLMPSDSISFYMRQAQLRFGTESKFTNMQNQIKDILMVSMSADTLYAELPGMKMAARNVSAGAGSLGKASDLLDSTSITPIGAKLKVGRLSMLSVADSSRIGVRGFETSGSIKRFENSMRLPLLEFSVKSKRVMYGDRDLFMGLSDGDFNISANVRKLPKMSEAQKARRKARLDSLIKLYPHLDRDSVISLYMAQRRAKLGSRASSDEILDLSLDNEFKKIFRKWDLHGEMKARKGRLFTPYFPLKNSIENVEMNFTTDSFNLRNMTFNAGKSDMSVSGKITNIRSALMGMTRKPLTIQMELMSDTLDLNELMGAMYKGSAYSASAEKAGLDISENADDNDIDAIVASSAEDTTMYAIIIPKNIAVEMRVRDKYARYSDLDLQNLQANLMINKGVMSVRNLSGKTDDGALRMDFVYATANRDDIGLGMLLNLDDINVGRFLKLMPDIDTIMPMLKGVDGIINARLAVTTKIDSLMNVVFPTTNASLHINGKNLVVLDTETYKKISKWLLFKNKNRNMIDSLSVEATAYDSKIDVYPFILNMDRYRLGVMGWNDFDMNFNYHLSVLKSPIPFKFGINIKGNADNMKIRLGKAKVKENQVARTTQISDSSRVNLYRSMEEIFRKGAEAGLRENSSLYDSRRKRELAQRRGEEKDEELTHADSLQMMDAGLIERPDTVQQAVPVAEKQQKASKRSKKQKQNSGGEAVVPKEAAVKPENE